MTTAQQGSSGGGLVSKVVVVALLALAIALYLRIVMVEGDGRHGEAQTQVSVQVLEGSAPSAPAEVEPVPELPQDQMDLIREVFAPELAN